MVVGIVWIKYFGLFGPVDWRTLLYLQIALPQHPLAACLITLTPTLNIIRTIYVAKNSRTDGGDPGLGGEAAIFDGNAEALWHAGIYI